MRHKTIKRFKILTKMHNCVIITSRGNMKLFNFSCLLYSIFIITFSGCSKKITANISSKLEKNWITETLYRWNEYNLLTNLNEETLVKAKYKHFFAEEPINVYNFNDGKTLVGTIEAEYLAFAITRFKVDPKDRNWTWFLVVKYQQGDGFWDGIIPISIEQFMEYHQYGILFLNVNWNDEFRNNEISCAFAILNQTMEKIDPIYFLDNTSETVKIIDRDQINKKIIEVKAMPEEIYNKYFISFNLNGILNKNEYMFSILVAEEITFGNLIWNTKTDEINIEFIHPIFIITGKECDWELLK
jgi:hypothetical protein